MITRFVISVLLGMLAASFPAWGVGQTMAADGILEKATGHRFPDPVTIQGKSFSALAGGALSNYRLYASSEGRFEPIRFQIDEMTEQGDFVFPHGSKNNRDQSNGILDERDLVLFMAHDAGARVSKACQPKSVSKSVEIEIIDPVDQTRSWVYLLLFEKDPPPLSPLPDYTDYDYETETLGGEYWRASFVITEEGKHTNVYKEFSILPKGGGNGENFMDRVKIRTTIKLFFGRITFSTDEEKLKSYPIPAWIQGPIRVVRRLEHVVKGPMGMTLIRILSDVYYYETFLTIPIHFNFPFKMERVVTSLSLRMGTDYAPVAKGSMFYNNNNLQGIRVNGKMDETEDNFNAEPDTWRVMVGEWGAYMTRKVLTPEAEKHLRIVQGITDDETYENPPERYPGNIGWTWQDWRIGQLPGGHYTFYLETYTPPHYQPGDEVAYLNYLDHPVKIMIANQTYDNQARLFGKPGRDF